MKNSTISWCDHTFNIAWGCTKVSPACDHCYAESLSLKTGFNIWGKDATRRVFGQKHWNEPLHWNAAAKKADRMAYVFCSSMCDIFEDHPIIENELKKLLPLIRATPNLVWLLLTKRWDRIKLHPRFLEEFNVRMGVTVENQDYDFRVTPQVDWISAEPLLGPLSLKKIPNYRNLKWVVAGGESGMGARPSQMQWFTDLIDECHELDIAFHFKQTGVRLSKDLGLKDWAGKAASEWPPHLRIQEFIR